MSDRSKAWQEKKSYLDRKEHEIRADLEETSTFLEDRTKKILKIALIAGGAALVGYLAYKALSSSDDDEVEEEEEKPTPAKRKKNKTGSALGGLLTERLLTLGLNLLASRLSAPKAEQEEKD